MAGLDAYSGQVTGALGRGRARGWVVVVDPAVVAVLEPFDPQAAATAASPAVLTPARKDLLDRAGALREPSDDQPSRGWNTTLVTSPVGPCPRATPGSD